jgi:hypothetical protein
MPGKERRSQRTDDMIMVMRIAVMVFDVIWEIITKGSPRI